MSDSDEIEKGHSEAKTDLEKDEASERETERLNLVNCKYLLFLGSGRTGSSVVGQVMNCHPNILVSNESRALQFCFKNDLSLTQVTPSVCKEAIWDLRYGTKQYDDEDKKPYAKLWQRDWVNISELRPQKKGDIKYVGDKKQGGNTKILMANRDKWPKTLDMKMVPITVMRNPVEVLASYLALGSDRNDQTLQETIDNIFHDMGLGYRFIRGNGGIAIKYESLLSDHREWCISLCKALDLEANEDWINIVGKIVTKDKKQYNTEGDAFEQFKSSPYYPKLIEMYNSCDF